MDTKQQLLEELMSNSAIVHRLMAVRMMRNETDTLSSSRSDLLVIVECHSPMTLTALAKAMQLTPGAITQLVENLEKAGLVQRTPSEKDRRVTNIMITAEGKNKLAATRQQKMAIFKDVYRQLSVEELRTMAKVQQKMIEHLKLSENETPKAKDKE